LGAAQGLVGRESDGQLWITQAADGKCLGIPLEFVEEILDRYDENGALFLQVNFQTGLKILLTTNLIGFKPVLSHGVEINRLPRVVTTPDLGSVIEALQDLMIAQQPSAGDFLVLKGVGDAIVAGAEAVGFSLHEEKQALRSLALAFTRHENLS
jgi:hypothetical protein